MGRLWDDHFGDVGYLPKFYGAQDARFTIHSSNGKDFTPIFTKNNWGIQKSIIPAGFEKQTLMFPKKYKDENDHIRKIY